jgi:hypothetical protein
VADTALKTGSKCSFTIRKLRFLACLRLVSAASPTFFNDLLDPLKFPVMQTGGQTLARCLK